MTAPETPRADWPVPDEAIEVWRSTVNGQNCCSSVQPRCFRPTGHDGDHGLSTKDEWLRYGLGAVSAVIVAATLRQAAERYVAEERQAAGLALAALGDDATPGQKRAAELRSAAAAVVALRLDEWADEVQP